MGINLESFEVECSCDIHNVESNNNDIAKSILDNPISNEFFGFITNSNIEVLKCIKKAFNKKRVFKNYGGLMMVGILIVQIIAVSFIRKQIKQIRIYIYSLILKIKFPPKRKITKDMIIQFKNMRNSGNNINNTNNINNSKSKEIVVYNSSSNVVYEKNKLSEKKLQVKNHINNNGNKTKKNKNSIKYQLIKQGSINSISTFNGNSKKYTYAKKGSIPDSTQYTNNNVKAINNQSNSSDENNNDILNINNNSGSGSGSIGSFSRRRSIINSHSSNSALRNLGEIGEQSNDEYEDFEENGENNKRIINQNFNFKYSKLIYNIEKKDLNEYIGLMMKNI